VNFDDPQTHAEKTESPAFNFAALSAQKCRCNQPNWIKTNRRLPFLFFSFSPAFVQFAFRLVAQLLSLFI